MEKVKFYDTNALLHNDIEKIEGVIYISSITLQEIENIKVSRNKDDTVKFNARKATRFFKENEDKYKCVVVEKKHYDLLENMNLPIDNDNLIIACAKLLETDYEIEFITNDICCYNIAKQIMKLKCNNSSERENDNYKGYIELDLNTDEFNKLFGDYLIRKENNLNLLDNQYLIINNIDTNKTIEYKYLDGTLYPIKLPSSKVVKGMNAKQRCALDLLNDKDIPIKIIAGTYGSGKTYLSVRSALYQIKDKGNYSKLMLVRNPIGSGQEVGFLSGSLEEKTKDFYAPIIQNLEGGEYELSGMKAKGELETQIPYYMKGMSLNNTFVLADEAEDLDTKIFKLIGTRVGENSCIAFVGDWKQAESKFVHNNGLSKFINFAKGNPLVGIIVLDDDVRSDASKVFCDFE